jgi:hypothetical protein
LSSTRSVAQAQLGVAARELGRFFVGAEKEVEFCELAARRTWAAERGGVLREILAFRTVAAPGIPSPSEV